MNVEKSECLWGSSPQYQHMVGQEGCGEGGGGIQKKENNQQDVIVNVLVKQNILTCLVQSVFRDFPFLTFNQAKHDNNVLPRCFGCSF